MIFCVAGVKIEEVKETVENHLKDMIIKHFDPKKADIIFYGEATVSFIFQIYIYLFII